MSWNSGVDFTKVWFPEFIKHCKEGGRGNEFAEMMSDSARENLLNSHMARHMREFGRRKQKLFWARCEWATIDVTFGVATKRFKNWEVAWRQGVVGELGVIESKLVYEGRGKKVAADQISTAEHQLRTARYAYQHALGQPLMLIAWYGYGRAAKWLEGKLSRFTPVHGTSGFELIGTCDERAVWPREEKELAQGHLELGLFTLEE